MTDVAQASGLFWATVFGAALGVVAGTIIQYLLTMALNIHAKKRQKKALIKELVYNRSLVDELSEEAKKLRNAVNGNLFSKYFGTFQYDKAIFIQANAAASSGLLYELLSKEDIRLAQRIISMLSVGQATGSMVK